MGSESNHGYLWKPVPGDRGSTVFNTFNDHLERADLMIHKMISVDGFRDSLGNWRSTLGNNGDVSDIINAAIQTAADADNYSVGAQRVVYLPPGNYHIKKAILTKPHICLLGSSPDSVRISATPDFITTKDVGYAMVRFAAQQSSSEPVRKILSGLKLYMYDGPSGMCGIFFDKGGGRAVIENTAVNGSLYKTQDGILFSGTEWVGDANNTAVINKHNGFKLLYSYVSGCYGPYGGLYCDFVSHDTQEWSIKDCIFTGNGKNITHYGPYGVIERCDISAAQYPLGYVAGWTGINPRLFLGNIGWTVRDCYFDGAYWSPTNYGITVMTAVGFGRNTLIAGVNYEGTNAGFAPGINDLHILAIIPGTRTDDRTITLSGNLASSFWTPTYGTPRYVFATGDTMGGIYKITGCTQVSGITTLILDPAGPALPASVSSNINTAPVAWLNRGWLNNTLTSSFEFGYTFMAGSTVEISVLMYGLASGASVVVNPPADFPSTCRINYVKAGIDNLIINVTNTGGTNYIVDETKRWSMFVLNANGSTTDFP